jgi:5-methylcytosine-specific restriction protein A
MRRSHVTRTLVIVSNHIKSIYGDRWLVDSFHYTGMGTKGDQSLDFAQNKTLSESNSNGVAVHLFEVFVEKEYSYIGQVELSAKPYFEKQADEDGLSRDACVFPLGLKNCKSPIISKVYSQKAFETKTRKAKKLSNEEVEHRAKNAKKKVGSRNTVSQQYERDPWIVEYAKRIANGICQLCENEAPFKNKEGEPYLETHHIVWLAKGGEDTIENTVALCPNCHRKMHVQSDEQDIQTLHSKKNSKVAGM